MIITGRTSLLALIDREKAAQGLSDAELSPPLLYNLRSKGRWSINLTTALALLNTLGFDLTATSLEN